MKILEAYTAVDIRTCGKIITRVLESGRTVEQLRELASTLTAQAMHPATRGYLLKFKVDDEKIERNEDVLTAIGLHSLRTFNRLTKLFRRRGIDSKEIGDSVKRLRRIELDGATFGKQKE